MSQVLQQMQETQISSKEAGYLEFTSYSGTYYSSAKNSWLFMFLHFDKKFDINSRHNSDYKPTCISP